MSDADQMRAMILKSLSRSPPIVNAQTFARAHPTDSKPVELLCDDGNAYVVKGLQLARDPAHKRVLINDQVIARLGMLIGAPVGCPALVDVPAALILEEAQMNHMEPGIGHGCLLLQSVSPRLWLEHAGEPANRTRFSHLALLYGWVQSSDLQVLYETIPPYLVHSVDHGHFIAGPGWDVAMLATAPSAKMESNICSACSFTEDEIRAAIARLVQVSDTMIAGAVAAPPDGWAFSVDERVALALYLTKRRDELLAHIATNP